MDDPALVRAAWDAVEAALPTGWHLDSLRCASAGLLPAERSAAWVAEACGPSLGRATVEAADAVQALHGLVARIAHG